MPKEIADHAAKGGMLGISKESWMAALEKENYLKAAEMSMEDDYGMIDGIINNGPKEDKTAEVKSPKGAKSPPSWTGSSLQRLKSRRNAALPKAQRRLSCEQKSEMAAGWSFFIGDSGRRKYNRFCVRCVHSCKQSFRADLIACPHFSRKASQV